MHASSYQRWSLAVISGLVLAVSWPMRGFPLLSFAGFVPLFLLEDGIRHDGRTYKSARIFAFSFLAFGIWNLLTTYWIKNAHIAGLLMALLVNGSLMSLAFLLYHKIRNQFTEGPWGQFLLVFPWLAFEYFHLNWELSWSWMNLGNVFATWPRWVQWYEYTGTAGGTVWVLLMNALLYRLLMVSVDGFRKPSVKVFLLAALVFAAPSLASFLIYNHYEEDGGEASIVIVQPNIDPYNEKYGGMSYREQIGLMLDLAREKTTQETDFVVFPESAIQELWIWERELDRSFSIDSVNRFLDEYPHATVILGASTYRRYLPGQALRRSARYNPYDGTYYDPFNTVLFMEKDRPVEFYHKSKLVAGVENMPWAEYLGFINDLAIDMGGIVGTLGTDDIRAVYRRDSDSLAVSTVICYESVYGEFFSRFVQNGAKLMFIITNDGWWGDTPGYKQHFSYASLRAIETRRSIARAANTGISGFIDQRGDILERSGYWVKDVMSGTLRTNDRTTFYVRYGDYLGRTAAFATVLLLLISLTRGILRKHQQKAS